MTKQLALPLAAISLAAVNANAAIIVTTSKADAGSAPTISNTDLAQTQFLSSSGTGSGDGTPNSSTNSDWMFDGNIGNEDTNVNVSEIRMNNTSTLTLNLDTSVNTLGYDITQIDTFAGWNPGGNGRSNQGYSIVLGFVGGGTATLVNAQHWEPNSPSQFYTVVSFTNSGGGALFSDTVNLNGTGANADAGTLATGVQSITWNISQNANAGGIIVAREFDVYGVATVPESSSLALLGFGGLLVAARRRRA